MLRLVVTQCGNESAAVELRDAEDRLRADVRVRVDGQATGVRVRDYIQERGETDSLAFDAQLLRHVPAAQKAPAPTAGHVALDPRERATVLLALRLYRAVRAGDPLPDPEALRAVHDLAGQGVDGLTPADMDALCSRIGYGD